MLIGLYPTPLCVCFRHDGLPVDDPMDIDDNVPGDHFGRENDPSQPLPSREEQPTIRVPPSVIDSGIQ